MGWDFDDFYISKSYVVSDIDQFIGAIMGHDGETNTEVMGQITPGLHHNMEDLEEKLLNPYEADAMEMAIRSGNLLDHYARAYHAGPDSPGYAEALEEGLRIGRPLVNEAAEKQNTLNAARGIGQVPLPFDENGKVNRQHLGHNAATVKSQKLPDGSFNPYHTQNGKLVTHIISGHNGNVEGYARWYEEAAKDLGYVDVDWDKSGKKRNRNRFVIPAQYVHHNVITINDSNMSAALGKLVKGLQTQAQEQGMNPEQAFEFVKQGFMAEPLVYHHTHQGHHNFDSTYGRIGRKAEQAAAIRAGDEAPPLGVEDHTQVPRKGEGDVGDEIIHPELQETKWMERLGQGSYRTNKQMVKDIARLHELDEEDVRGILDEAYKSRPGKPGSPTLPGQSSIRGHTPRQRILNGLYDAHMNKTGGRSPQWYSGPEVTVPGGVAPTPPEAPPQEAPPAPPPDLPPPHIPVNPPAPPAPPAYVHAPPVRSARPAPPPGQIPPPFQMPSHIPEGNANIPSPQSTSDSSGGRTILSGLAELLGRMSATDILRRSEDFRGDFENYIEEVQLELAKSVIDDLRSDLQLSVDSPMDVALLSSKVQMGTNDVITIFHTRGDWRQIAKSFNIPHENVQMVKVALYG